MAKIGITVLHIESVKHAAERAQLRAIHSQNKESREKHKKDLTLLKEVIAFLEAKA